MQPDQLCSRLPATSYMVGGVNVNSSTIGMLPTGAATGSINICGARTRQVPRETRVCKSGGGTRISLSHWEFSKGKDLQFRQAQIDPSNVRKLDGFNGEVSSKQFTVLIVCLSAKYALEADIGRPIFS